MLPYTKGELARFVTESNRIEGIIRPPSSNELRAHDSFFHVGSMPMQHIVDFVDIIAPGAKLRTQNGMDVYVGNHHPPAGGPGIGHAFSNILVRANDNDDPYLIHCEYETLHPFMDGNGRSGRALWAWMMLHQQLSPGIRRGFLHQFYYQTLDHAETRRKNE